MGREQGLKRGWALTRQEEKVGVGAPRKRELRFRSLEEHGTSGSMRKGSTRKWRAGSVRFLTAWHRCMDPVLQTRRPRQNSE